MSHRTRLRAVCSSTGLTSLVWKQMNSGLYVFTYHRVGDASECEADRGVFSCTAARFREHLELYRDRFEFIDLEDLFAIVSASRPLRRRGRPLALLTFDDGYIDNYTVALPALREFGLTAVFFIATAFVGSGMLPWWDEIAWAMRHATTPQIRLWDCNEVFDLRTDHLERSIMQVLLHVRTPADVPISERIAEIQEACRPTKLPSARHAPLFMSWDQIRDMRRAGMEIGSHTHTHPVLSHLDASEQRQELGRSKTILEDQLGERVMAVAYPAGRGNGYTSKSVHIARSVGYEMGFNFRNLSNARAIVDPLDIHRLDVDGDIDSGAMKTRICFPWL